MTDDLPGNNGSNVRRNPCPPIRVLMASTSYPSSERDWKGLFILQLTEALARRNDIALHIWSPPGPLPNKVKSLVEPGESAWLGRLMKEGGIAHLLRNRPVRGAWAAVQLLLNLRKVYARNTDVNIYHINWLQNALVVPKSDRPILLTALGSDIQMLAFPGVKPLLRRALNGHPTAICPNAEWMVEPLTAAFRDVAHIQYIPFGIDPRWFKIIRSNHNLSVERWLVVSRLTTRKLGPLFDWCRPLFRGTRRELHLFGPMQEEFEIPDYIHYHGPTTPTNLAEHWFPQASGLITLSQHAEGRPQVMLEAMAAGLPIVASRLPAHEDLLRHQETGWLCGAPAGFAKGVTALSDFQLNRRIGSHAKDWVATHIGTWDHCAQRYTDLYRALQAEKEDGP